MIFAIILLLTFLYAASGLIYRLVFHPLATIPGPKLAGATGWYEFYYDVVRGGRYTWKISELHDKYGDIIRISPCEVHIRDSSFMDEVYPLSTAHPTEKWPWAMRMFGSFERAESTKTLTYRRQLPYRFFSKSSTYSHALTIQERLGKLTDHLAQLVNSDRTLNLTHVIGGLMQDVILKLCFEESFDNVEKEDFGKDQYDMNMALLRYCHLQAHVPLFIKIQGWLPRGILRRFAPSLAQAQDLRDQWLQKVQEVQRRSASGMKLPSNCGGLFEALVTNEKLPAFEKTTQRLLGEAVSIVGAGLLTPTEVIKNTIYFVLADPHVHATLMQELRDALSTGVHESKLEVLEKLPYLNAVIHEGLRISYGVPHRLQRVHPKHVVSYQSRKDGRQFMIPPGTPIGMTSKFVCDDELKFPNPRVFDPDRWISRSAESQISEFRKETMVFGRGSRDCVGMHLAYAAMYLTIGTLFLQFGYAMKLRGVDRDRDVEVSHDYFVAHVARDSPGVTIVLES